MTSFLDAYKHPRLHRGHNATVGYPNSMSSGSMCGQRWPGFVLDDLIGTTRTHPRKHMKAGSAKTLAANRV